MVSTVSTLGGVEFTVVALRRRTDRRVTNIIFERSPTVTQAITKGPRTVEVEAVIRNDADADALEDIFDSTGEAEFVDDQRGRYTGTYVLGSLFIEDRTRSSVNIRASWEMTLKPDTSIVAEVGIGAEEMGGFAIGA